MSNSKQENISENQSGLIFIAIVLAGIFIFSASGNTSNKNDSVVALRKNDEVATQQTEKTFYTISNVNVRECASLSCDEVGQYPINTDLTLPYNSISEMPEWIQISWDDNDTTVFGYVSKTVLSESRTKIIEKIVEKQPVGLSSIIKSWRPRIAYIECTFKYSDTGQTYYQSSGSGTALELKNNDGNTVTAIVTNRHVFSDENGYGPNKCVAKLPDNDFLYEVGNNGIKLGIGGIDWGYLHIINPDNYIKNLISQDLNWCQNRAKIGESLIVLGYPSYGSDYSEITATEGIISGYDEKYYTTSAKIEQGNSGGIAILEKDNCYLGIPTAVRIGAFESLGRILDVKYIFQ